MKKITLVLSILLLTNGCTQIITAPIAIAGSIAGAAIDVTAATARAVTGSNNEDEEG